MYNLKVYDNEKKVVILEIRSDNIKVIFDYTLPYLNSKYQVLIKSGVEK